MLSPNKNNIPQKDMIYKKSYPPPKESGKKKTENFPKSKSKPPIHVSIQKEK